MGNFITYTKGFIGINDVKEHTIELGRRHGIEREGSCEDMVISRSIAHDCPIKVCLLLRTNGDLDVWYVEFERSEPNPYWHFAHLSGEHALTRPITNAQLQTINRLRDNVDIYADLGGMLGADIIKWAYGDEAERVSMAYHD